MERVRDYGGFIVWFMGLGYLAAWAMAAERLAAFPAGLHAIGLTAVAFLPLRFWAWWRERRIAGDAGMVQVATQGAALATPSQRAMERPTRPHVKPRNHFGLRGMPPQMPPR